MFDFDKNVVCMNEKYIIYFIPILAILLSSSIKLENIFAMALNTLIISYDNIMPFISTLINNKIRIK